MGAQALQREHDFGTVLVIDDEVGPRESLQIILKRHFQVYAAASGEQAIEVLGRDRIDVVTLDLKMPEMSGPETLARIRQIDPNLEVIVVTGYGSFESAVEVLRLRAFDYIGKPFESRRILDVVRRAAELSRQRRESGGHDRALAPLDQIVDDVERWQRNVSVRLGETDRVTLDRILGRLRSLRARIELRFGSGERK